MKLGRNEPCHCGSGKKYKRCCIEGAAKQQAQILNDVETMLAMNLNLTIDELNVVLHQKMEEQNNQPHPDFCGLSAIQMNNWLYEPFEQLELIKISTPDDLSVSPVMRYLELIFDEAMNDGGSFKATAKGNLPLKLVNQANELLPEFAVSKFPVHISLSEFAGSNEDRFNALHYTRVLAEVCGIIYLRGGRYHVKKAAQKQYQTLGLQAFFKPMLEAAVGSYNWGYFDLFEHDIDLRLFWVFMLWRLQKHSNFDQLVDEVVTAFPDLLQDIPESTYSTPKQSLEGLIEVRFIKRFLQFWGFVIIDPRYYVDGKPIPKDIQIQPLLGQVFQFEVNT